MIEKIKQLASLKRAIMAWIATAWVILLAVQNNFTSKTFAHSFVLLGAAGIVLCAARAVAAFRCAAGAIANVLGMAAGIAGPAGGRACAAAIAVGIAVAAGRTAGGLRAPGIARARIVAVVITLVIAAGIAPVVIPLGGGAVPA